MPQPDRNPLAATRAPAGRRHEPAPRPVEDRRPAAPPAALIGRLRGAIPASDRHRARLRRAARARPAQRADRGRRRSSATAAGGPPTRSSSLMIEDVRAARRRRRHGDAPGRDRRPRPAPRRRDCAAHGRPAPRGCSGGSMPVGCRRRRSATRDRRGPRGHRSPDQRRRPRPSCRATATRPRWTVAGGRPDVARRPRRATPGRLPRRVGLVGCGRESDRHPQPDLDPDPRGHVHLRDARLGLPDRHPAGAHRDRAGRPVPDRPGASARWSTWHQAAGEGRRSSKARGSPRSVPAAIRSSRSASPTAGATAWSTSPGRSAATPTASRSPSSARCAASAGRRSSTPAPTAASCSRSSRARVAVRKQPGPKPGGAAAA